MDVIFLITAMMLTASPIPTKLVGTNFTDKDLDALFSRGGKGVIYAVSEHMPLSVRGLREINLACAHLELELVIVVDPDSNPAEITYMAKRFGFLPRELLRLASPKLMRRNLTIHYPAIQPYDNGRFVGVVLPGYMSAEAYKAYLTGVFSTMDLTGS